MMLISVIIPIYNAQSNIENLINDLSRQEFEEVEFLLIDDGSVDNTYEIIESTLGGINDKRFTVIHTKNNGVSVARNLGLKKSQGKYIIFVDSDDRLDRKFLEKYYEQVEKSNSDIALFPITVISKNNAPININCLEADEISKYDLERKILNGEFGAYLFGFIFSKKILNNIVFNNELIYKEDLHFLFKVLEKDKKLKISVGHNSYYYYIENTKGGSVINNSKAALQSIWVAENIEKILNGQLEDESLNDQLTSILEAINYGLDFNDKRIYNLARNKYLKKFDFKKNNSIKRFIQYVLLKFNLKTVLTIIHSK